MSDITINKVAVSDGMMLYSVNVDGVRVLDAATMDEVMEFLTGKGK